MKSWENLTLDEQFASVRRDLERLLVAYQQLNERISALSEHLVRVEAMTDHRAAGKGEDYKFDQRIIMAVDRGRGVCRRARVTLARFLRADKLPYCGQGFL